MSEQVKWISMTTEQAKAQADVLLEEMKNKFPGIVEHFNTDAVRYQNQELPKEAYLLELHCMERSVFEVMKLCSLYVDIFDAYKDNIGNKEQIEHFVKTAPFNMIRLLGAINRHYKILES